MLSTIHDEQGHFLLKEATDVHAKGFCTFFYDSSPNRATVNGVKLVRAVEFF